MRGKKKEATKFVYKRSHASESDRARAIPQGHQLYKSTKPQWKIPLTQWKCPLSNKSIDMADRIGREPWSTLGHVADPSLYIICFTKL